MRIITLIIILLLGSVCVFAQKAKKPTPTPTPRPENGPRQMKCPKGTHLVYKDYRLYPWACEKNK